MENFFHELLTLEAEYACFNSRRTLSRPNTGSARWTVRGDEVLIENPDWPENTYVNRVVTVASDLDRVMKERHQFRRFDYFSRADEKRNPSELGPAVRKFQTTEYFRHELRGASEIVKPDSKIQVELCRDGNLFLEEIGRSMETKIEGAILRAKRGLYCTKTFRGYFARIEGEIAGLATLYIHERAGWFANAFTFPSFRKRGVHSALLRYRLDEGKNLGLAFAYTDAVQGSESGRNAVRAGFKRVATAETYETTEL